MSSNILRLLVLSSLIIVFFKPLNAQNVGIGTTNPDEKLTVIGTIKAETNSCASVWGYYKMSTF